MRSTFKSPVSLSSSYLTFEPLGISIRAVNSSGAASPMGTSCQGWGISGLLSEVERVRGTGLLAEVLQDGLVGVFFWHQDLRAVVQHGRVALQLEAGHLAVSSVQHQPPGQRYHLPDPEVRA